MFGQLHPSFAGRSSYTSFIAISRTTHDARLYCTTGLILYFLYIVDGWYGARFIMDMLQCDLLPLSVTRCLPATFSRPGRCKAPLSWLTLFIEMCLGGCPASIDDHRILSESPGWRYLSYLKPRAMYDDKWIFLFYAAGLIVASIPQIPSLRGFFELAFNQYLGRILFAFYLVHGPILWTIADRLLRSDRMPSRSSYTHCSRLGGPLAFAEIWTSGS